MALESLCETSRSETLAQKTTRDEGTETSRGLATVDPDDRLVWLDEAR
jgi:hypothetical protein